MLQAQHSSVVVYRLRGRFVSDWIVWIDEVSSID